MGMMVSINEEEGFVTSGGVFDCIVESTRLLFTEDQKECMWGIYKTLDEQGQSFIVLDDVDADCFNLFYRHCEAAMKAFPESERGKIPTAESYSWNTLELVGGFASDAGRPTLSACVRDGERVCTVFTYYFTEIAGFPGFFNACLA